MHGVLSYLIRYLIVKRPHKFDVPPANLVRLTREHEESRTDLRFQLFDTLYFQFTAAELDAFLSTYLKLPKDELSSLPTDKRDKIIAVITLFSLENRLPKIKLALIELKVHQQNAYEEHAEKIQKLEALANRVIETFSKDAQREPSTEKFANLCQDLGVNIGEVTGSNTLAKLIQLMTKFPNTIPQVQLFVEDPSSFEEKVSGLGVARRLLREKLKTLADTRVFTYLHNFGIKEFAALEFVSLDLPLSSIHREIVAYCFRHNLLAELIAKINNPAIDNPEDIEHSQSALYLKLSEKLNEGDFEANLQDLCQDLSIIYEDLLGNDPSVRLTEVIRKTSQDLLLVFLRNPARFEQIASYNGQVRRKLTKVFPTNTELQPFLQSLTVAGQPINLKHIGTSYRDHIREVIGYCDRRGALGYFVKQVSEYQRSH